jgi:antitoxin component of MazEF toxin-antitoxin module
MLKKSGENENAALFTCASISCGVDEIFRHHYHQRYLIILNLLMQTLEATLSTWGKSTALHIPALLVKQYGLKIGQTVRFESGTDRTIIMRPLLERPNLDSLLTQVTQENMPDEADISC